MKRFAWLPTVCLMAAVPPPALRLGEAVRPLRYAVELRIDPRQEPFTGIVDIDVHLRDPTQVIWMNADGLVVTRAAAQIGGENFAARVLAMPKDFVGFAFERSLPPGGAHLRIEYSGKLGTAEVSGPTRQQENGEWYAFTHFEPMDARRAYPCFDEPSFKVPWQLTLDIPEGDQAFSNSPMVSEYQSGNGAKQVKFAPTLPLPSYLTAWAVGPLDIVDAGKSPRSGAPVRVLAPKGHGGEASWAAESSAPILGKLEDYFGDPYPYEKLDLIAVPLFRGAMENPGLVTFAQRALLQKPEEDTLGRRRAYGRVAAHELAHQWFGDWVTNAWWNDLWLNEAFASWMELNGVEAWQPGWDVPVERANMRSGAMQADSLLSARKIRQPIETNDDIKNAFDGITYSKGASVIRMFEQWLGPAVFRAGLRRYFAEHQNGNATAAQLLAAISAEAGQDVATPFSTFLDQSGVPLISMEMRCSVGRPATLHLAQRRYLPLSAGATAELDAQLWQVPISVRWAKGQTNGEASMLLTGKEANLVLKGAGECPDWVLPNAGAAGYYRSQLSAEWEAKLFKAGPRGLTVPERLGALSDLTALARAGAVPYSSLLARVPQLAQDSNRNIVDGSVDLVSGLRDRGLISPAQLPAFAKFIRDNFGRQARSLGWQARGKESEDRILMRRTLVPLVADQGEDGQLIAEAHRLAASWFEHPSSVDPEMVDPILWVTAKTGDRAQFETWRQAAVREPDRSTRRRLLGAMANFRDPEIVKSGLELTLGSQLDPRESIDLLWGATRDPRTQPLAYEFVKAHFDELVARLPRDSGAAFPNVGTVLCDDEHFSDVKQFFEERSKRFTGGPRILNQALEGNRLCVAFRKAQQASIDGFFKSLARRKATRP